jgi:thioredoxin-dependent peroxiredoxin
MKVFSLVVVFVGLWSVSASASLVKGQDAPEFVTSAAKGGVIKSVSLSRILRKGPLVLYFYPAAFTPGCTVEANQFAEAIPEFKRFGATVLGASADDIATLKKFSVTECRSKFAVAVATPAMVSSYGVALSNMARSNRTSFIIAPDGKIIYAYASPDYRGHVINTLNALKAWRRTRRPQ